MDLVSLDKVEKRIFSLRHYLVVGNKSRGARISMRFAVVCSGIERAIELAKKVYPDMVIFSVADHGAIDKVDVA